MKDKAYIGDEIVEGNKLIAEFMGWSKSTYPNTPNKMYKKDGIGTHIENMAYHSSWDWLMPVVEKIEKVKGVHCVISELGCDIYSFGKHISNCSEETKILTVWIAAIKFITWYNQNKQS